MSRLGLSIGSLFLAALLLYVPVWIDESDEDNTSQSANALTPTYQAKNLTTKLYDIDGNLTHEVFAKSMEHFELLGFVSFEQPEYTLYPNGGEASWRLNASQGTLYDSELLELEKAVRITSMQPDEFVKTVQTEFIKMKLNEQTISSDQPVVITGDQYTITGNGFNADLDKNYYELQNHVKTVFSAVER